jgi:hypothetical protein
MERRPGAGRKPGSKTKSTLAPRLAEAEAMSTLPEQFQGNALALLQAVYRNAKLDLRVRIDAASKALPYEVPKQSGHRGRCGGVGRHAAKIALLRARGP